MKHVSVVMVVSERLRMWPSRTVVAVGCASRVGLAFGELIDFVLGLRTFLATVG